MAQNTSFDASLANLRKLFTSAERTLLDSSTGKKLAATTESQVKALLKQGRILRDKWRDLVGAQMRNTKRARRPAGLTAVAATTKANERSRQKSDLLASAVARLEGRLRELAGGSPPAKPSGAKPSASKPTVARRAAKRGGKKSKVSRAVAVATVQPRAISKKARQAGARKALESVGTQGLNTSSATQRKATAALKADRLKIKGITTRRAGHAQSRVGKAQARRDQRNAGRK